MLEELRAGLPVEAVLTDSDRLDSYRHDSSSFCPAGSPAAVVRPTTIEQVCHVLTVASAHRVPVVPQGARTGLSGGANAIDGCIVLTLERMDRILEIDPLQQTATVQAGVVNADLSVAVAEHGLFYPPDPSSWETCTIGGNLATNAGGLCCVKYGVTADWVRALTIVLASGEVLRTGRRTAKGVAGYDPTGLFVGSEGTLGVICEAVLRLRPAAATPRTVAGLFPDVASAADATARVAAAGVVPSLLEFMDATSLRAANDYRGRGLPEDAAAMLIAQSDAGSGRAEEEIGRIADAFSAAGGFDVIEAEDAAEGELLLAARRENYLALKHLGNRTGRNARLVDDVCVPRGALVDMVEAVEKVAADQDLPIAVVGHVGDGNLHPNVVFDGDDPGEVARAIAAFDEIMRVGLALGGTITGEHGVGVLKRRWLERELDPVQLRVHRELKTLLDPGLILNPGKVLDFD